MANHRPIWKTWGKAPGPWRKAALSISVAVVLVSVAASYVGVTLFQQSWRAKPPVVQGFESTEGAVPVNPFASANGLHLMAFVIAKSDCGWSSLPSTMDAVRRLPQQLRAMHSDIYAQITVVGVVLDRDIGSGLSFASEIGEGTPGQIFDQLIVGGSWLNEEVVRFVWREGVTVAASPQIIVLARPVNTESYLDASRIDVGSDQVLVNPIGNAEIVEWINLGVPLDYEPYGRPSSESEVDGAE